MIHHLVIVLRVSFSGGKHSVDVVPAMYEGPRHDGMPLYLIPDGYGDYAVECEIIEGVIYKLNSVYDFKIIEVNGNVLIVEVYDN